MTDVAKLNRIRTYPEEWERPYFQEAGGKGLSAKAANSVLWAFFEKFSHRGIHLVTTAIAARILVPSDFGLVGMATLVMGFLGLFKDYGLSSSIIYDKKIDQIDLSTAFWVNIAVGISLCLAMFFASPLAAAYFVNDKITNVVRLLSLNFIITGIGVVNGTILIKSLRFKELAVISAVASIVQSSVTLFSIIYLKAEYWSIIFGMISFSLTDSLLKITVTRWLPKMVFDTIRLKNMFNYGKNIFLQKFVNYFNSNIDYFLIGRLLGASRLGIYQFAFLIPHSILFEFSQTVTKVLFPLFCQVQDDPTRFKEGYLKTNKFISMISFPAMIGLFYVADQFILLIFGDKYIAAVLPMRILCFSGMARSILHSIGVVFNSKGRPDLGLKWNLCLMPIVGTSVYVGTHYGLGGVAAALAVTSYFSFIGAYIAMRLARIPFLDYIKSVIPAFLGSVTMLIGIAIVDAIAISPAQLPVILEFVLIVISGITIYTIYYLVFQKETVVQVGNLIKNGILRR